MVTLIYIWNAPGDEMATWPMAIFAVYAIQRTRIASRPLRSYSAIQRYTLYSYTSRYTIQPMQHPSASCLCLRSPSLVPPCALPAALPPLPLTPRLPTKQTPPAASVLPAQQLLL